MALQNACRDLCAGDSTGAIVAGANLIMGPATSAAMTSEGVLSPEGSCKTFDASADGFARADGIVGLYIKRLDHALRDGNPIRAIIRGSGTNSDGRSNGLLVPRAETQEALIRKVYADAGLDPSDTSFVEVCMAFSYMQYFLYLITYLYAYPSAMEPELQPVILSRPQQSEMSLERKGSISVLLSQT